MPTLKHFSGPVRPRGNCGCEDAGGPPTTQGPSLVPGGGVCGPGPGEQQLPGNAPVSDEAYRCSIGVQLQGAIDQGRRVVHTLGLRPYRVFLVWQQRGRDRIWQCVCELELVPVRIVALDNVDLELSSAGLQPEGMIALREVSPAQVTEDDLRGYFRGELWGKDTIDREFFYEVRLHERCRPEDLPASMRHPPGGPRRRRFVLGSEPHFEGNVFEWRVGLVDQEIHRNRVGQDQTIDPGQAHVLPVPRLVP